MVDMFPTTSVCVDMFPHTDGILDMFPHTADIHSGVSGHVETVVQLFRKKPDTYLNVDTNYSERHK